MGRTQFWARARSQCLPIVIAKPAKKRVINLVILCGIWGKVGSAGWAVQSRTGARRHREPRRRPVVGGGGGVGRPAPNGVRSTRREYPGQALAEQGAYFPPVAIAFSGGIRRSTSHRFRTGRRGRRGRGIS